jgi:acetamidase/formamidase
MNGRIGAMGTHSLEPTRENLHGHFSRDLKPVLRISSGDTVRFRTLDAAWGEFEQSDPFSKATKFAPRTQPEDNGHCLVGPVYVEGLRAGDTLEVKIKHIRTGAWGWSSAGGFPSWVNNRLGMAEGEEVVWRWKLDPDAGTAVNQHGRRLKLRPFLGVMGMPADEDGQQPTAPPRFCGGNIDCKELVQGTSLFLPVAVDGGLFSLGDGHAVQGDGEVASPAVECPMELVEVELHAHPGLSLKNPRAQTPAGWVTLGFH